MRKFVIAANWKMHKSPREARAYFSDFLAKYSSKDQTVIFFVPAVDLSTASELLRTTDVAWGAQNAHFEAQGAFTGETSPNVLAEMQTPYLLIGHSERRQIFHETEIDTAKKLNAAQRFGLVPLLCVGETLAEREAGATVDVITRQLTSGLSQCDQTRTVLLAYEPVWAIGTGKVATPAQAQEAHAALRQALKNLGGSELAEETRILYGGSVKPENAQEIANQPDVDGFLVGGASLEVDSFLQLCEIKKASVKDSRQ